MKNDKIQQMKDVLFQTSKQYKQTFNSEYGKAVLQDLRENFEHTSLVADNPHQTVVRAAQREIIDYIQRMVRFEGENE